MLTTNDLYTRPGYNIDVGDSVRFNLLKGLEFLTNDLFKLKTVRKSRNQSINQEITGKIINYQPNVPGDLEIEGLTEKSYTFRLKLSQCKDLQILS